MRVQRAINGKLPKVCGQSMISDDENVVKIAQFRKMSRADRKTRAKKEKEATAAANRIRFGRSGHEKKLSRRLSEKDAKAHEAHRREKPGASGEPDETD
jgi:hypothetical protein